MNLSPPAITTPSSEHSPESSCFDPEVDHGDPSARQVIPDRCMPGFASPFSSPLDPEEKSQHLALAETKSIHNDVPISAFP